VLDDLNDFHVVVRRKSFYEKGIGMNRLLSSAFGTLACLAVAAGTVQAQTTAAKDIVTTAVEAGSFKTLAAAVTEAGLVSTLQGKGPFTVFAPTDAAFQKLPAGTVESLLKPENRAQLVAILTYHVVPGKLMAADVVKQTASPTVNGQRIDFKVEQSKVLVDSAQVVKADLVCSNGVIHVIDTVLLPSSDTIPAVASKAGKFQTLLKAAEAAGLVDVLSGDQPLTVFAPTDAAFAKLPAGTVENLLKPENRDALAGILKYHVVSGRVYSPEVLERKELKTVHGGTLTAAANKAGATIQGATLLATDIDAANGVIHVIDSVLLPPAKPVQGAHVAPAPAAQFAAHVVHHQPTCQSTPRRSGFRMLNIRHR